ncbi:F-box domain-containing protein [Astrocystis sublimbata]|nr:F-box domain-containing protein [Astrocystis sublimbata]
MGDINLLAFFLATHSICEPAQSRWKYDSHMATHTSIQYPYHRWSLDDLSTELLVFILEQLSNIDSRSLSAVRLVSRRFNAIVTPLRYQTLLATPSIIDPRAETYFSNGVANVRAHSRHVTVNSDLNAEHVKTFLHKLQRLSSIRWRYVQEELFKGDFWVPSDVISPQHRQNNQVKLYIENLPLRDFRSERHNPYLRAVPTEILASLIMAAPTPPFTARVESLKGLLLNSPRLDTFSYNDRGQGTQFQLSGSERLPAFKHLSLRSYNWNHDSTEVQRHWDFSKIRHLEMIDVPLGPFFDSIRFTDFRHLDTLRLDDFSTHLPNTRLDSSRSQYTFIKQISALVDLKITCNIPVFPIDGILQHAQTLRSLRFRDYTGFSDENSLCPTIQADELYAMSQYLINLRILEIDMDERLCQPHCFLDALCRFPQMNTLTLHIQTALDPSQYFGTYTDVDYDRAMQIFTLLVQGKQAALWRSITINVGGWKPIMVRRLSAEWRELNNRGLYAERCFIMEKDENGSLSVHEEFPTRAS